MVLRYVRAVPPRVERTDWRGFLLLVLFVIALQITLDQGNILDWFDSRTIVLLTIVWVTAGTAFFARGIALGDANVMKLRLFKDANFAVCALVMTSLGTVLLAFLVLAPQLCVGLLGWEVVTAGGVIGFAGARGPG